MGRAAGNGHGSTGSPSARQSLAGVLPAEGAVSLAHAGFPPWGLPKASHHFLPQTPAISHAEGVLLQLHLTEQSSQRQLTHHAVHEDAERNPKKQGEDKHRAHYIIR